MSLWIQEDIYIWNNDVFYLDYQTFNYFNLICVYEDHKLNVQFCCIS